jgi:hypothetical protein
MERDFYLILIGINIGAGLGWYAYKHFGGNLKKLMDWFDGDGDVK